MSSSQPRPSSVEKARKSYARDDVFYFAEITFLVEDTLFRVPRRNFEAGSEVFRDMFAVPQAPGLDQMHGAVDGTSDAHPLRLDGSTARDFRRLLSVMFPAQADCADEPLELTTPEEWSSVLRLATIWRFDRLRALALQHLASSDAPLDPADKLALARECHVPEWVVPALNALARREEGITVADVEKLGLECALKIARVREVDRLASAPALTPGSERTSPSANRSFCYGCRNYHCMSAQYCSLKDRASYDFTEHIRKEFGL